MGCTSKNHPKFEVPTDPEGKRRYESAKRHAELASQQGKSSEEIHEIFRKVMEGTGKCPARQKKE